MKSTLEIFHNLASLSRAASGWCVHNPNVAAAVYDADGNFVAEGVHRKKVSDEHAEVVALKASGSKARGGSLYLSLEPCNHKGTTPPCVDAIKASGIKKVVYAVADPHPIARGGAEELKKSGIEVVHERNELLEFEQRGWLHRITRGRPLITAKVAITLDGYIAALDGGSKWITSEESRQDVQHLRAQMGAVITSTETFLNDQPSLLPRLEGAPTPDRFVMGKRKVQAPGFNHIASQNHADLIENLNSRGINHALVEAGGTFLAALMRANLIDELVIYQAPKILGSGKKWIENLDINSLSQAVEWERIESNHLGPDLKTHYRQVVK